MFSFQEHVLHNKRDCKRIAPRSISGNLDPDHVHLQLTISFEGYRPLGPSYVISPNKWRTLICFNAILQYSALSGDGNSIVTKF